VGEQRGCGECLFEFLEGLLAVVQKVPRDIFPGEPCEGNCNLRVAVNETPIEIGKPEERHDILGFLGFGPVLDGLDFILGHCEAIGKQHLAQVFTGFAVELALVSPGIEIILV